jgi:hypothetical protein
MRLQGLLGLSDELVKERLVLIHPRGSFVLQVLKLSFQLDRQFAVKSLGPIAFDLVFKWLVNVHFLGIAFGLFLGLARVLRGFCLLRA